MALMCEGHGASKVASTVSRRPPPMDFIALLIWCSLDSRIDDDQPHHSGTGWGSSNPTTTRPPARPLVADVDPS